MWITPLYGPCTNFLFNVTTDNMIKNEHLADIPLLVVANKQDIPVSVIIKYHSVTEANNYLDPSSSRKRCLLIG